MTTDGVEKLVVFFGVPLNEVNALLLRVALEDLESPPDWLKGKNKLSDLPRWRGRWHDISNINLVKMGRTPTTKLSKMLKWIIETLKGFWHLGPFGFCFESVEDAIYFKMRWS